MQVKAFVLGGMSYGGAHSSAIVAAVPERVMGWFLLAPVVSGSGAGVRLVPECVMHWLLLAPVNECLRRVLGGRTTHACVCVRPN